MFHRINIGRSFRRFAYFIATFPVVAWRVIKLAAS